jgi:hypothetical protein
MDNSMWFKQKAVRDREEYVATAEYFVDSTLERLESLTEKEWMKIIEQLWEVLFLENDIE